MGLGQGSQGRPLRGEAVCAETPKEEKALRWGSRWQALRYKALGHAELGTLD